MVADTIQIRPLLTPEDHQRLQAAQDAIWGPGAGVVSDQSLAACKFGGIAMGAFDGGELVGFCYGWPAFEEGQVWLHSHILGVFPAYRGRGLGARLKQAQRAAASRLGYRRMTWTYDPLEAPNAHLNIAKLGGTVRRYLVNCYGEMDDALNQGIPSDRFLLEWNLEAPDGSGEARPAAPLINPGGPGGVPDLGLTGAPALRLAIPPDFRQLYQRGERERLLAWRLQVRSACLHYLAQGYSVTGFSEGTYVLTKEASHS
jgi:predicted GNAT superfamily acetyltransferase